MSTTPPGGFEYVKTEPIKVDLDELPAPVRPSRRLPVATIALGLCAMAGIGFAVGVAVEKRQLPASSSTQVGTAAGGGAAAGGGGGARAATQTTVAGAGAGAAGGAGAGGGGFGAQGGGQGAVVGQVKSVEGTTILVTDSSGNVVKVTTSDTSQFTRPGALGDIKPGDYVTVQGMSQSDGSTQAVRINDTGSTPPAAGALGPRGGAGGGGATPSSVPGGTGPTGSRPNRTSTTAVN